MHLYSYFFTFITAILGCHYVAGAEFVPVYMWGTSKVSEHVPALHKISEESFKDTLLEYLKNDPFLVVFAEHTLSPEDFAQRNPKGEIAFPEINGLREIAHINYRPYVQNPIGAIKTLDKSVTELSIASLLNNPNVPKDNILIIDLNDAKDDEERFHLLKRHDSDIVSIYKDFVKQHDNVLAIYTSHHTSWVTPEGITHKESRSLLAVDPPAEAKAKTYTSPNVLLHLSDEGFIRGVTNISIDGFVPSSTIDANNVTFTLKNGPNTIEFSFLFPAQTGYWYLWKIDVTTTEEYSTGPVTHIFAPTRFSYHCGKQEVFMKNEKSNITLSLPGFQIHPTVSGFNGTFKFGDAYDCVGFTSIPIWSGLFVTLILLSILTFGLTMLMDIKTMDRFDDAKGKTITISATD